MRRHWERCLESNFHGRHAQSEVRSLRTGPGKPRETNSNLDNRWRTLDTVMTLGTGPDTGFLHPCTCLLHVDLMHNIQDAWEAVSNSLNAPVCQSDSQKKPPERDQLLMATHDTN